MKTPMVSICMLTYNHERHIRDAINGVLIQETNFSFELIIGDDSSTDKTSEICQEYAKKFPEIIKYSPSNRNLGMIKNFLRVLNSCLGKYIAFCEGDDYWIDPFKLQKQVDFMETNSSCSLSFHSTILYDEIQNQKKIIKPNNVKSLYTLDEILKEKWVQMTCSLMIKRDIIKSLPDWFNLSPIGDLPLRLISGSYGNIGYIDDVMAVYRKYSLNSWSTQPRDYFWSTRWREGMIKMYINFNQYSNNRYASKISKLIVIQYKIFILRLINNKTPMHLIAKYYCKYFKVLTDYQRIALAYKLVKYFISRKLMNS